MLEREQGWCFDGPRKDIWAKSLNETGTDMYASLNHNLFWNLL
jgi:hypothetical protein